MQFLYKLATSSTVRDMISDGYYYFKHLGLHVHVFLLLITLCYFSLATKNQGIWFPSLALIFSSVFTFY